MAEIEEGNKSNAGAPPKFDSVEALSVKADKYFDWIKGEQETSVNASGEVQVVWKRHPEPPTITGLILFLGFESRQSFYDYVEKAEFSYTLKRYRLMIECKYEQNLHGTSPTGSIFALKNMGWKDKTETELSGKDGGPVINLIMPKGD